MGKVGLGLWPVQMAPGPVRPSATPATMVGNAAAASVGLSPTAGARL